MVLYNLHQGYRRRALTAAGDQADFFHFDDEVLREVAYEGQGLNPPSGSRLFPWSRLPVDDAACSLERLIVRHVSEEPRPDALLVEETLLHVLWRILRGSSARGGRDGAAAPARHRGLVERARELLAATATEDHRLPKLAKELGCSVFHLCRAFRSVTGTTLHRHRTQLRLRASLDLVTGRDEGLSAIAYDLGFSSHSHFTDCFRRAFGMTPSALRNRATRSLIKELVERASPKASGGRSGTLRPEA